MIFSLRFNNDLAVAKTVEAARCAEQCGFDQFWVSHDLFLRSAPVILSAAAIATRRIRLGTCILNPYTVSPAEIAMTAASLHELSGGRFLLGVAAGASDFLKWVGIRQDRPLATMRETLYVLRRMLKGEVAEIDGRQLRFSKDCYLRFGVPFTGSGALPPIPLYLGANGPKMLALAGELADGVLPLLFPPEHYHQVRPLIAGGEKRRDAGLEAPDVAACVWVSIDPDGAAATQALAHKVAYYGHSLSPLILQRLGLKRRDFAGVFELATRSGDFSAAAQLVTPEMMRIGIAGTAEDVLDRLRPLVQSGVRHVSFGPPLGPNPMVAIKELADKVLPGLREAAE